MLQDRDPRLYEHLQSQLVVPTTFGTNWTKLLFSRQFPDDFPLLWDCVVATDFTVVDSAVVAMVEAIRGPLLDGDSVKCNTLLVSRYPPSVDARFVLQLSLHILCPARHPRPTRSPFKFGLQQIQQVTRRSKKKDKDEESETKDKNKFLKNIKEFTINNVAIGKKITSERKMVDLAGKQLYLLSQIFS